MTDEPMTDEQMKALVDECFYIPCDGTTTRILRPERALQMIAYKEIRRLQQEIDQREVERLEALTERSGDSVVIVMNELLKQAKEIIREDREATQAAIEAHTPGCHMGCPVCRPLEARLREK